VVKFSKLFVKSKLITFIAVFVATTIPLNTAFSEQIYKVRFGEQGFSSFFQVGHKSFRYTERGFNSYYGANLILTPCAKASDSDCIDSLSYKVRNSNEWLKSELDTAWTFPVNGVPLVGSAKGSSEQFVIKNKFPTLADPINNYPAGGATSIWKTPQSKGTTNFRLFLNINLTGTNPDQSSEVIKWNQIIAQAIPISMNGSISSDGTPGGKIEDTFGEITSIKVRLRVNILKQILNGWVHSRTVNPEIVYGNSTATGEYVDISGDPLSVPTAEARMNGEQYLSIYENPYMKNRFKGFPVKLPDPKVLWGTWGSTDGIEQGELKMWSAYEPFIAKEAVSLSSMWKLVGAGNLNLQRFNSSECISSGKIDGILATNATQYSPTPPIYLESSQELSYQLAAPHFKSSNEEFKGSYSLVVSEKLAKCIWGNSPTNASARISILNSEGTSSVVTQSLKQQTGFYYFNINGFGFSAPTIRIKLTQDALATAPTPSATPTIAAAKPASSKKVITCAKGKVTKKVTGTNPKCPSGYKRVA
jgi:hypothetical protein